MIYLDYAASTPIDPQISWRSVLGNSASTHQFGRAAQQVLDTARDRLCQFWDIPKPTELIFTSGATESNVMLCYGVVLAQWQANKTTVPHVVTSSVEHASIREPLAWLERAGFCTVTAVSPDSTGRVAAQNILAALQPATCLVTLQYVNNEVGTIQPIAELGQALHQIHPRVIFHTDAAQAEGVLSCSTAQLQVDAATFSAHKMYGPQGVGALYLRSGLQLQPILQGGGQEFGWRSGTVPVALVDAFAQAAKIAQANQTRDYAQAAEFYDYLTLRLKQHFPRAVMNGSKEHHVPHILNWSLPPFTTQHLVTALDQQGVAVSAGAACQAGAIEPSAVLQAMGVSSECINAAMRWSWGRFTTQAEIELALAHFYKIINN